LRRAEKGDLLVISATIASANAYRLDLENVIILSESNSTILEASQRVLSGRPVKSASDQNEQSHTVNFVSGRAVGWEPPSGVFQVEEPLETLFASVDDFTTLQAQRALEAYVGKWYAVQGEVDDISGHGGRVTIYLEAPDEKSHIGGVIVRFSAEEFESISHIRIGYRLGIGCKIEALEKMRTGGFLMLSNCQVFMMSSPTM
jgi:hypothetical protein